MIVLKKQMLLFALLEPKEEVVKLKHSIFDICQLKGCYIQPLKVLESIGVDGVFLIYFAVLSVLFKLKQSLEAQSDTKIILNQKMNGLSMEL